MLQNINWSVDNSIRLFAGTGMPEALSQRVAERFGDASIMEIYLSTRHHAYLANLKNNKSGAVFQQLPGSNDIALVHWDYHKNLPFYDAAGYLCPTPVGAVGMLLVKADNGISYRDNTYISDVFEKGDGWQIAGDLFLLDNDGDYHFVDRASNLILTKDDAIPTPPIETAISTIDGISVATAYGVTIEGCDFQVPVASVVLKGKFKLVALDLTTALTEQLDNKSLPLVVIVANSLPMTPSYQVQKQILADTGIPQGGLKRGQAFWFNNKSAQYESLTQASLSRLIRDLTGLAATESATARAATKGSALGKKRAPKKTTARKKKVHTKTAKKRDLSPNIVKKETELNGGMSASDMTDGASSLIETTGQDAHLH